MKTWNEIKQEIINNFPDNNNKEITASRLRTVLNDVADTAEADKDEIDTKIGAVIVDMQHLEGYIDYEDAIIYDKITNVEDNYASKSYISANYYDKEWIDNIEIAISQTDNELNDRLSVVEDNINESNNIVVGVERKIGTWTEADITYDLYEKIVNFGELPNSETKQVDHGVTNKVKFVYTKGDAIGQNSLSIPFVNDNGSLYIYMGVGNTKITIKTNSDRSNLNGYITLRYIRTRG